MQRGSSLLEWIVSRGLGLLFVGADVTLEFGKLQEPFFFQFFEELPAFMSLQAAVGPLPFQQFTDREGQFRAAEPAAIPNDFPNQFQFFRTSPVGHKNEDLSLSPQGVNSLALSSSLEAIPRRSRKSSAS